MYFKEDLKMSVAEKFFVKQFSKLSHSQLIESRDFFLTRNTNTSEQITAIDYLLRV